MRRHLLDRPAGDDAALRTRAFATIARAGRVNPASRALQQQKREERASTLAHALRAERARPV